MFCKEQYWDFCFFFIYVNDLPNIINTNLSDNPKTVLFADDASAIVNNPNFTDFENIVHMVFENKSIM